MEKDRPFDDLAEVWKRVEASRPKAEGSAALMPRRKKKGFPLRPFPPQSREKRS